jgi:hypothetical protein
LKTETQFQLLKNYEHNNQTWILLKIEDLFFNWHTCNINKFRPLLLKKGKVGQNYKLQVAKWTSFNNNCILNIPLTIWTATEV